MNTNDLRISRLREYLFSVIDTIKSDNKQINANMLSDDIDNYSLDKIPVNNEIEKWIIDVSIHRDVFSFRSRMAYSQDVLNNLANIGFFEQFEQLIKLINKEGILPDIDGIESIECLNCGTMANSESNTAEFDIQIQITYRESEMNKKISL